VLREYRGVLQDLLRAPQTLYTAGIMLIISISNVITGSFWGIIVTERLHIPAQNLAIFPFVKSAVMLFFFFMVMPRFNKMHFKLPLVVGFLGFVVSQLLLITAPERSYLFLIVSVFLEACCFATINPLMDQMIVLTIDPKERARIQSILYVGIILITSPFGWIAGNLSGLDKSLPFILNIALFGGGAVLAYLAGNAAQKRLAVTTATP
jgi:Na+/melibiose symporter-like transporter